MFNATIFCFAFILMFITHGIADYWLQTDKQAKYKSQQGWFGSALWGHVIVYTASFVPALVLLGLAFPAQLSVTEYSIALASIGGLHILMDQRGFLYWFCEKTKGWTKDVTELNEAFESRAVNIKSLFDLASVAAVRMHVGIEMDQKYHFLCLGLTAAYLAFVM